MFYEEINIKQGTPEWLALRVNHVTASQVPLLMGMTQYRSLESLINEKLTGINDEVFDEASKQRMQRGHDLENSARRILTDYNFKPAVLVSKLIPGFMASLDGIDKKINIILECKYTGNRTRFNSIRKGIIPRDHFLQMQAQLVVSGAIHCLYWVTDGKDISRQIVKPDEKIFEEIKFVVTDFNAYLKELKNGREERNNRVFEGICKSTEGS